MIMEPARAALATWRLEPGMSVGRPTSGVMNETLLITMEERLVVLRRHRRPERRQIELEHRVIAHARHNGIPAPAAIPTPETRSSLHDHWLFAGTYARNDDRLRSSWNPDRSYRSSTTGRGLDRHSSD